MKSPPVFILMHPQLSENIGTAFRALANCGLYDLRLVNPKKWPDIKGEKAAAGAEKFLHHIKIFTSLKEAIADIDFLVATTARERDMVKPVFTLPSFWPLCLKNPSLQKVGVLFGPERNGLTSEDLSWAAGILSIPLNPDYNSLNLAQAVLLVAYGWYTLQETSPSLSLSSDSSLLATQEELWAFFEHFESLVETSGFFYPPELRPKMVRNLRNVFMRAHMTDQEVRTFRGVASRLQRKI